MVTRSSVRAASVRAVVVRPDDGRRETLLCGALALVILALAAWRLGALEGAGQTEIRLHPYQQFAEQLAAGPWTLYRALQASVADIEWMRDAEGVWPETMLLASELVPPFAEQLLPATAERYLWLAYDGGSWVDYWGQAMSEDSAAPSFILRLIDLHAGYHPHPHPGIDYDPTLSVAVQVWWYPRGRQAYPGERLPEAGWVWLVTENDPVVFNSRENDDQRPENR